MQSRDGQAGKTYGDVTAHVVLDDGERRISEEVCGHKRTRKGWSGGRPFESGSATIELTKEADHALCRFEELNRVDASVGDGHVDERLRGAKFHEGQHKALASRTMGRLTFLTVSK